MQRLVLVSNRLAITVEKRKEGFHFKQSVGGLATGLSSFYKTHKSIWVGWCGLSSNSLTEKTMEEIRSKAMSEYNSYPSFLSIQDIGWFYSGFCNRMIWPLFHYFPDYAVYDQDSWESYQHVNEMFCQDVLKVIKPDDIVWIHDYHLMLLPKLLREKMPDISIGYFLHIPFPSHEIFRLIPWRKELLEGLLGADLIGFHTYDYVRHFISSVRRLLGYEHIFGQFVVNNRLIKTDAFPMGIDYYRFADAKPNLKWLNEIIHHCRTDTGCKIVLSIDRLDYTKGIPQRLEAYDLFLEKYPEYKKKVTLVMVAVPSRTGVETYRRLKQLVDEWVGRINGKHGAIDWMPVWYLYRSLPFEQISSLYNIADVALVTPLRDGMNLIAKEYIASRKDNLGVLILSEMAGARSELAEALIVNPNNKEEVADSIFQALTLSEPEQIDRNRILKNRLLRYDVVIWAEDFLNQLKQVKSKQEEITGRHLTKSSRKDLIKAYNQSKRRMIFLDYDGTVVPFAEKPHEAKPDEELFKILHALAEDPSNEVIIISGRDKDTLDDWFGNLNIGLSAEHGVWMKNHNQIWEMSEMLDNEWKEEFRAILERYVDRTPRSFIEEKTFSLAWHYRKVDHELGEVRSGELKEDLLLLTSNRNLMVLEGSKVIEVKCAGINKGRAVTHWMSDNSNDFILALGDDWTDEDIFEALPDTSYTIKVGLGHTKARFFLPSLLDARDLLITLINR